MNYHSKSIPAHAPDSAPLTATAATAVEYQVQPPTSQWASGSVVRLGGRSLKGDLQNMKVIARVK